MVFKFFNSALDAVAALFVMVSPSFLLSSAVHAQSPMPYGLWRGLNSGDYLMINLDHSCSATGIVNVAGRCVWLATAAGGVLNMYYPMPLRPGRIGWSVIWINRNTLRLNGVELFVRQ